MTRSRTSRALMDKGISSPRNVGLKSMAKMTIQRALEVALCTLGSLPVKLMDSQVITPRSILLKKQMRLWVRTQTRGKKTEKWRLGRGKRLNRLVSWIQLSTTCRGAGNGKTWTRSGTSNSIHKERWIHSSKATTSLVRKRLRRGTWNLSAFQAKLRLSRGNSGITNSQWQSTWNSLRVQTGKKLINSRLCLTCKTIISWPRRWTRQARASTQSEDQTIWGLADTS